MDELQTNELGLNCAPNLLSSGQRQRLAIARSFLKPAPILIMDEPTSKLDVEGQAKVLNSIRSLGKNKTVIFVSHIPAEIATADRVLVFDQGKVIEDGSQCALMQKEDSKFRKRYLEYNAIFQRVAREAKEAQTPKTPEPASSQHPNQDLHLYESL